MKQATDFLGISKKKWTEVLGANLALLFVAYAIACICTASGSDFFMLSYHNESLENFEATLRGWNIFALIQALFLTIETAIVSVYVANRKPKWWLIVVCYASYVILDVILTHCGIKSQWWHYFIVSFLFCMVSPFAYSEKISEATPKYFAICFIRMLIACAFVFSFKTIIGIFRLNIVNSLGLVLNSPIFFCLDMESYLALGLALGFLTLLIPWEEGDSKEWTISRPVGSSSLTSTKQSPTSSKSPTQKKKTISSLPREVQRKIRWLYAKVFLTQTIALAVIASLPWIMGKEAEFSLMYASFVLVRFILGFKQSLHYKRELVCVTVGAVVFWGLTFASPSIEVSIIGSLVYGTFLAVLLHFWYLFEKTAWYQKVAKPDRFASLFSSFKGNIDQHHVRAVMESKRFPPNDILIVQAYLRGDKVAYIATQFNQSERSMNTRLDNLVKDIESRVQ